MKGTTLAVVAATLALLAGSALGEVPNISCSFTADITLNAIYNYHRYSFNYKHYSSAGRVMRKVGEIPLGYPGNSSMMFRPPNNYYFLEPFFGRTVCSIVPLNIEFECFKLDSDAWRESYNVTCPNDRNRRCDVWTFTNYKEDYIHYWIYTGTNDLHKVKVAASFYDETYIFNSFDSHEPNPSIFEIPKDQPCIDLVKDPSSSSTTTAMRMAMFAASKNKAKPEKKNSHVRAPSALYYNPQYAQTDVLVNDPIRIKEIAAKAKTWKAGINTVFEGKTMADFSKMLRWPGLGFATRYRSARKGLGRSLPFSPAARARVRLEIPETFDAREQWPQCGIDVIRDQGSCGSCWAFGAVEALEDRFCIHGKMAKPLVLSPQYLVSCYKDLDGCDGGFTDIAWEDLVVNGTTTEECLPYKQSGKCPATCVDGSEITLYKPKNAYSVFIPFAYESNVKAIQQEIMINGPVETT